MQPTTRNWWSRLLERGSAILLLVLILAPNAHALKFSNQFIEFELPNNWKCGLEGAEWTCQNEDVKKKREAIVVLAAKLKGDQDSLQKYEEYLKKPRTFDGPGGKKITSAGQYTHNTTLNTHIWVDSLHMQSEIPDFYTRYLATVEKDIGVLVTYSIAKAKYAEYKDMLDNMIKSLKVFRKSPTTPSAAPSLLAVGGHIESTGIFPNIDPNANVGAVPQAAERTGGTARSAGGGGLLFLLAAGGGGYFYWKKKQKSG